MQPRSIGITTFISVLAAATTAFPPHSHFAFSAPPALAQTSTDRKAEADQLLEQGTQQFRASQFQAAKESYQQALTIYREIGDRQGEANSLGNLGNSFYSLGQYQKAIEFYQQSLAVAREIDTSRGEADSLGSLGNAYYALGEYQKALEFYQQSLVIARELGDRQKAASSLGGLGNAYYALGQYQKAIEFHQQSLTLARQIRNREGEANSLGNLGNTYYALGQYQKAIEFHQQSLSIAREIGDRLGVASSLGGMGNASYALGQYQKAIEFHQQSLTLARQIHDRVGEAKSLGNLGIVYYALKQYQQAIEFHQQSLTLARELGNRQWEASSLGNLGVAYYSLEQYEKAIEFYQQQLTMTREIGDRQGEANALGNLGVAYYALGLYQKVTQSQQQWFEPWLAIVQESGTQEEEIPQGNVSLARDYLKHYQKAITFYQQWLAMAREIGDREGEGIAFSNMGQLLEEQNQPELAIVFYKQSVNVRESIRRDIRGLPQEQQQSYIQNVADTYRSLADLLLKQDRVLEAQRVLDLLKVQELEDYLNQVRGNDNTAQGMPERSPEQQIKEGYNAILDKTIERGKELAQLESIPMTNRTQAQRQRLIELRKNQEQITQQFQEFLKSPKVAALVAQLRQTTVGESFDLGKYATNLQDNLKKLQQDAVILYPLVLDDRLELVLITPYAPPIRRTVPVKREDLNRAILQFRVALTDPRGRSSIQRVQTPAQQLYNWLIKPIENDLAQAKAKTIVYAPDGRLRYIPLAALYDGNQWLVQRFGINNITAVSLTDFNTKPQGKLHILAGAFTKGTYNIQVGDYPFTFSGLPFAGVEVENLVQIVPNTTKVLDDQFNPDTVYSMNDYSVVHLATHGAFIDGQPENSFILFGNGKYATLRDIGNWRLSNVDLVVLSACQTALGDELKNGNEILGLGYQLQQTGTKATIASLWMVDDGGTQSLMNVFYMALRKGNITKAEALRQAQLVLITGDRKGLEKQGTLDVQQRNSRSLPPAANSSLSHPYYWAPFILIGNGL